MRPYLDKGGNFSAGVNFAVVGAPALTLTYLQGQNLTVNPPINSSLYDQLVWFQKLKPSLCKGRLLIKYQSLITPFSESTVIMFK
mgnify:CR=1 FL=1